MPPPRAGAIAARLGTPKHRNYLLFQTGRHGGFTMPNAPTNTDNALTIGLVLAGVIAILILVGSVFFKADHKSVDVTATQPTTQSPTTGTP